jgi:thiamine-phosphate pyrophosphorylase
MIRYAITDRARFPGGESARQAALLEQAQELAAAGLDFVQLREKDMDPGALADLTRQLLAVFRAHSPATRLLINSRADVAVAAGADGVHLTSAAGSLMPADIRRLYRSAGLPEPVVSASCHSLAEVAYTRKANPSMILFGPVFEKVYFDVKAVEPSDVLLSEGSGLNLLHMACAAAGLVPVLALGGVTPQNAEACLSAGAAGIAGIRLFGHIERRGEPEAIPLRPAS